jgi:hypothetical protein
VGAVRGDAAPRRRRRPPPKPRRRPRRRVRRRAVPAAPGVWLTPTCTYCTVILLFLFHMPPPPPQHCQIPFPTSHLSVFSPFHWRCIFLQFDPSLPPPSLPQLSIRAGDGVTSPGCVRRGCGIGHVHADKDVEACPRGARERARASERERGGEGRREGRENAKERFYANATSNHIPRLTRPARPDPARRRSFGAPRRLPPPPRRRRRRTAAAAAAGRGPRHRGRPPRPRRQSRRRLRRRQWRRRRRLRGAGTATGHSDYGAGG